MPAYNEVIHGFDKGCKEKDISIGEIYDLKGNIDTGQV